MKQIFQVIKDCTNLFSNCKTLILLTTVLSCSFLYGQTKKIDKLNLSAEQLLQLEKSVGLPWVKTYEIVEFLSDFSKSPEEVILDLPGNKSNLKATKKNLDTKLGENHWKGDFVQNGEKNDGDIIELLNDGEGTYGYANVNGNYYTIEALGGNKSIILLHDPKMYPVDICESSANKAGLNSELLEIRTGPNSSNCRVKVLLLHTQAAQSYASISTLNNIGNTGIAQTNTSLGNSGINGRLFKGSTGTILVNGFAETNNAALGAEALSGNSQVISLRNQYKADIVVVLGYWLLGGAAGSVAPNGFANSDFPVALIRADLATTSRYTFTHEIGHLFNARHDILDNNAPPGRGKKWKQTSGDTAYTLMSIIFSGTSRIQHFSNPDISFNGIPTGDSDRDNSFNINTNFCTLSSWIQSYDITLAAPSIASVGQTVSITPTIDVDMYPGTLRWYANTYPAPNTLKKTETITPSYGGFYSFIFPNIPINSTYYVKAELIPSNGASSVSKTVGIVRVSPVNAFNNKLEIYDKLDNIIVYPNPVSINSGLKFRIMNSSSNSEIIITNLIGQVLMKKSFASNSGEIDIFELKPGSYLLQDILSGQTTKFQITQ